MISRACGNPVILLDKQVNIWGGGYIHFLGGVNRLVLKFYNRKYTIHIGYRVLYTVCLILMESNAIDKHIANFQFKDFKESIMMFPDKINQIHFFYDSFLNSPLQSTNSFFSQSIFRLPFRTSRFKSLLVNKNFHWPALLILTEP